MLSYIFCACVLGCGVSATAGDFILIGPGEEATILVPDCEPDCVRLAADDLTADVRKITGRTLRRVSRPEQCSPHSVVIATAGLAESAAILARLAPDAGPSLRDKWEAYRVQTYAATDGPVRHALVIAGSDERGSMFGVYAFCEQYLGVDPMYFWTDREPAKRSTLTWPEVRLAAEPPTFRYRGWFINDEDLITGWKRNSAVRTIDYKFYQRVLSPEVAEQVYEAMLRLQYNLIIPSSFIDLANPDEARLVDLAVRRGLFVSMHHQEPLGVTGLYTFPDYWRRKGEEVPFSFVTHRAKFEEIWRDYVRMWSRYGDRVIWQLGLRGKGDRPLWATDPNAPHDDAARGRLISDAMALQWEIVRSIDRRPQPPATTTLWMEGSQLCQQGFLKFPPGMAIIFADNSPGWVMKADFFETQREPGRPYGIYYHPALWDSGPHFCQAVSPRKMHEIFKLAVDRGDTYYALLNVSNVREFPLNLDAGSRLLRDFARFDPDAFLTQWCKERFSPAADIAQRCYQAYFDSYFWAEGRDSRHRLDGETVRVGKKMITDLLKRLEDPKSVKPGHVPSLQGVLRETIAQRKSLEQSATKVETVLAGLSGQSRKFFETNFVVQQRIILGLVGWLENVVSADLALAQRHRDELPSYARAALTHLRNLRAAQALASQGKWQGWYDGDWLMDIARLENSTGKLVTTVTQP